MPTSAIRTQAGFSVLEAICALAILSLALVSLYQALGNAERMSSRLSDARGARIVASNVLDAFAASARRAMPASGRANGYSWSIVLRPAGQPSRGDIWRLYKVRIEVTGARGSAHIESYRVLQAS